MIEKLHYITQGNTKEEQLRFAQQACKAGVQWLQFRMKIEDLNLIEETALEVKKVCDHYNTKFIVNDRVELAAKLNADGVHIGKNDMHPKEARNIIGEKVILGCTSNTFEDIEKVHQYADYMGLGPFRFTTTKQNLSPVLGLNGYEIIIQQMESEGIKIPVIAIGGILVDDIDDLMKTGIHGIAVASLINQSTEKELIVEQIQNKLMYEHS